MKDSIKNFIAGWKAWDQEDNKSLVYLNWNHRFRDAGYIGVAISDSYIFPNKNIEIWCNENIGEDHYAWVGAPDQFTYWFENEETALQFSLRWL